MVWSKGRRSRSRRRVFVKKPDTQWFFDDLLHGGNAQVCWTGGYPADPLAMVTFNPGANVSGSAGGLQFAALDEWKIVKAQGDLLLYFDAQAEALPGAETRLYDEALVFYWWFKFRGEATTSSNPPLLAIDANPQPSANQTKEQMLRRNIISYGRKYICTRGNWTNGPPTLSEGPGYQNFGTGQGRLVSIPPPRIGSMGIRLNRDEQLRLHIGLENLTTLPNQDNGTGGHLPTILSRKTFRWLCAKV